MNNEIVELLRSVMKEELTPINKRLDNIEQTLTNHDQRFDNMDQRFDSIEQDIKDIKEGQQILQKNIIQSLGDFTKKMLTMSTISQRH